MASLTIPVGSTPKTAEERDQSRDEFLGRFRSVRDQTETLSRLVSEEDALIASTPETSPLKWHLAHTTWFFEQFILRKFMPSYQSFHPVFSTLFNSYYETAGRFLEKEKRNVLARPSLTEVWNYRESVEASLEHLLCHSSPGTYREVIGLVELGIQHEQQHQELILMDVKRNFYENPMRPSLLPPEEGTSKKDEVATKKLRSARSGWSEFEGGLTSIGMDARDKKFSFDNERGRHSVWLEPFAIQSKLVTNGEFLEFIEDGGYEDAALWLSDGWKWVHEHHAIAPLYWELQDGKWMHFTFGGMKPVDRNEPVVHLNYYEAQAFAKWKGARLPTEFEWEFAAAREKVAGHFLEDEVYHPKAAMNADSQFHGTVWEWTQSAYLPYPGFRPLQDSLGEYNGKFMCNQMVLRGGSCATPFTHYRKTYRNFYHPHQQWQFAGMRLARDLTAE